MTWIVLFAAENEVPDTLSPRFVFLVVGGLAIAIIMAGFTYIRRICSKCGHKLALERTGVTKGKRSTEKWECKYCGHTVWRAIGGPGGPGDGGGG